MCVCTHVSCTVCWMCLSACISTSSHLPRWLVLVFTTANSPDGTSPNLVMRQMAALPHVFPASSAWLPLPILDKWVYRSRAASPGFSTGTALHWSHSPWQSYRSCRNPTGKQENKREVRLGVGEIWGAEAWEGQRLGIALPSQGLRWRTWWEARQDLLGEWKHGRTTNSAWQPLVSCWTGAEVLLWPPAHEASNGNWKKGVWREIFTSLLLDNFIFLTCI